MRRHATLTIVAVLFAAALAVAPSRAQERSITVPPEELKAYEAVKNAPDPDAALAAAKAFLEQYPKSAAAAQVPNDVYDKIIATPRDAKRLERIAAFKALFPDSERALELEFGMLGYHFDQGNTAEIFRVGEAFLAKHPDDVEAHFLMLQGAVAALRRNDATYVERGKKHGARALELFAQPGVPPRFADQAAWTAYRDENLPLAYQSLGLIGLATNDVALASENLQKAADAKPKDPLNLFFLANLRNLEYNAIAQKFNAMPDKNAPEAKRAIDEANVKLDEVNRLLARAVAIAESDPQHAGLVQQARQMLEETWKQRHNGSLEGLEAAIKAAKEGM